MPAPAPAIYVGTRFPPPLLWWERGVAVATAVGCLTVLLIAAYLTPDSRGFGTHEALGIIPPCEFLQRTGIPCAGCGMTTSFADAVRGRLISAFVAQPFGLLLCLMTAAAFWSALYVAVTGRPAYRLLRLVSPATHLIVWPVLAILAWGWKIVLTVGWRG